MNRFDWRIFAFVFGTALAIVSLLFGVVGIIGNRGLPMAVSILLVILAAAIVSAAVIACYEYPARWFRWTYRAVMRKLAKKAVRASLSQAMTPIECLGIMEREGYVQLRLSIGSSSGITEGFSFRLLESTDSQQWGIVEVVNVGDTHSDCIPIVRSNENFWAALEDRMRYDTSSPSNIHLMIDLPESYMQWTEWLLDNWR